MWSRRIRKVQDKSSSRNAGGRKRSVRSASLKAMLDRFPGPVLRVGADLRIRYANKSARSSCRRWSLAVGVRAPDALVHHVARALDGRGEHSADLTCGDRLFAVVFQPVGTEVVVYGWEVTARKAAEESLRERNEADERDLAELEDRVRIRTAELQRRADQLARLTSELTLAEQRERRRLAKLLHDHLQQLLVGAKFGLQVLSKQVSEAHREAILEVQELIGESIDASRSLTVELSPPILHEAGLVAGLQWLARWMNDKHGLDVTVSIDPAVHTEREDVRVLVFEAVRELLFNVSKHAGVPATHLAVELRDENTLVVTVSDDGVGFDPEEIAARDDPEGFGLLSIRERLGHLGGRLEIESAVGDGSVFRVIAPVRSVAAPVDVVEAPVTRQQGQGNGHGGPIGVLLVDDHAVLRQGLKLLIAEEEDMVVLGEAADGQEAIEQVRDLDPDVVLMDFSMPRLDGAEATRIIRRETPGVCIIGLSMYEEADRADAMIDAGAVAYLTKSGDPAELLSTIRRAYDGDSPPE